MYMRSIYMKQERSIKTVGFICFNCGILEMKYNNELYLSTRNIRRDSNDKQ